MPSQTHQLATARSQRTELQFDLRYLFGPPPLLEGENGAAYEVLNVHIHAAVAPKDAIEAIWVQDIVDQVWETMRLKRLKANLMRAAMHNWVGARLPGWTEDEGETEARRWSLDTR